MKETTIKEERNFNPDLSPVLEGKPGGGRTSRYSLCTATAHLARQSADKASEEGEILTEKPVTTALNKILDGEYTIVEPDEIKYL